MRIKAEQIIARDLKPGDLFSLRPQEYWDTSGLAGNMAIGEMVYVRTDVPAERAPDMERPVFRLTIALDENPPVPSEAERFRQQIAVQAFGMTKQEALGRSVCISCKRPIVSLLKTELDVAEYRLSGMCPDCFENLTSGKAPNALRN